MPQARDKITRYTIDDVQTWYQSQDRGVYLSDVVDGNDSDTMSVGFARYAPGESNDWVVTYDEILIVTKGVFTVTAADGHRTTARAGEVIFLRKGTKLTYSADDPGAEVVYVTYPHWMAAQQASEHAALLNTFHPTKVTPPAVAARSESANIELMKRIWGPLERGESDDFQPFFDALADDVVYELPVGKVRGKDAVAGYLAHASVTMEFQPFDKPLQYYGNGDRVVIVGSETFKVKKTGATHHSEWAWVVHMHDGLITRIVHIQDLSGITDLVAEAARNAQSGTTPSASTG